MYVFMYNGIVRVNIATAFAGGDHNVSQDDHCKLMLLYGHFQFLHVSRAFVFVYFWLQLFSEVYLIKGVMHWHSR